VNVEDVMLKGNMLTARPADKLADIIPKLNKVSGLPVLDADGRVVGVITRKVRITLHVSGLQAVQQVLVQLLEQQQHQRPLKQQPWVAVNRQQVAPVSLPPNWCPWTLPCRTSSVCGVQQAL
jgi:hypothetical protein